jgi:hypothetical protein
MDSGRAIIDQLAQDFPDLPRETIVRQYVDALSSVELFAVSRAEELDLVAKLARCHLDALADLRRERED